MYIYVFMYISLYSWEAFFSSEYNEFLFFSLSVSPFGPHVSKNVRARMSPNKYISVL